jgi:hypothetical protein
MVVGIKSFDSLLLHPSTRRGIKSTDSLLLHPSIRHLQCPRQLRPVPSLRFGAGTPTAGPWWHGCLCELCYCFSDEECKVSHHRSFRWSASFPSDHVLGFC